MLVKTTRIFDIGSLIDSVAASEIPKILPGFNERGHRTEIHMKKSRKFRTGIQTMKRASQTHIVKFRIRFRTHTKTLYRYFEKDYYDAIMQ